MAIAGIVGGLGPESTIDYYRRIIASWKQQHPESAPSLLIDSLDVQIGLRLVEHDHRALTDYLLSSLARLAGAGADFAALSANTAHIVFDELAARSPLPLISIVEVCADEAKRRRFSRVGLLGTRFTMAAPFYPEVFARQAIQVVPPDEDERGWLHSKYVGELLEGVFRDDTRRGVIDLVERLVRDQHIDSLVLGGTELPLLLRDDVIAGVPTLDTTALHVAAIVARLEGNDEVSVSGLRGAGRT
jgi:aspartate racemase